MSAATDNRKAGHRKHRGSRAGQAGPLGTLQVAADRNVRGPGPSRMNIAPKNADHIRAFVAVALPGRLLDKVQAEQGRLDGRLARASRSAIRWTLREQLHLTLKFFGNVQIEALDALQQTLSRAVAGIGGFELSLAGLGCFPSPQRPSVVWLGLDGSVSALATLQGNVERETAAFGSHSETRPFHPHLTIGRVKGFGAESRRIGEVIRSEAVGSLGNWTVSEILLVRSQLSPLGSTYSTLGKFHL